MKELIEPGVEYKTKTGRSAVVDPYAFKIRACPPYDPAGVTFLVHMSDGTWHYEGDEWTGKVIWPNRHKSEFVPPYQGGYFDDHDLIMEADTPCSSQLELFQ